MTHPQAAALQTLLERVEAGDATAPQMWDTLGRNALHAMSAFNGSLNAAKALHDAVLPAYRFRIEDFRAEIWWGPAGPFIGASETPARAWLIAILRALIADTEGR